MRCSNPNCTICVFERTGNARATPVRDAFPSLSLMSTPASPAPPRLRLFPGAPSKWRCRVELRDIARKKHASGLSLSDYAAPAAEGWGNTKERAYRAWESKWRSLFKPRA